MTSDEGVREKKSFLKSQGLGFGLYGFLYQTLITIRDKRRERTVDVLERWGNTIWAKKFKSQEEGGGHESH